MKLNELMDIMNDSQLIDVYYRDKGDSLVKCASRNLVEGIDEKFEEAEVICLTVTKYNTFDVIIEKPIFNKRYTVNFSIPTWIDLDEEIVIEFEDDETEREIEDRIAEELEEWLDRKLDEIRSDVEKEVTDIEEY